MSRAIQCSLVSNRSNVKKVKSKLTRHDLQLLETLSKLSGGMANIVEHILEVDIITEEQRRIFDLTLAFLAKNQYGQPVFERFVR